MRYYVSLSAWRKFEHDGIINLIEKVEAGKNVVIFGLNEAANNRMLHILDRYIAETRDSLVMEDADTEEDMDKLHDFVEDTQVLVSTTNKSVVATLVKEYGFEIIEVKEDF